MTQYPFAGLDALARMSMLNPQKRSVRAISRTEARKLEAQFVKDMDRVRDENLAEIQVWEYNPELLSKNGTVDVLSLALSLGDSNDTRVEQAMTKRLQEETWYTD